MDAAGPSTAAAAAAAPRPPPAAAAAPMAVDGGASASAAAGGGGGGADSDDGVGPGGGREAAGARRARLKQRRVWNLKRKFADVSGQYEAALCEAHALLRWRGAHARPAPAAASAAAAVELSEADQKALAESHARRQAEAVAGTCMKALREVMRHQWAYVFNSPVDTRVWKDYANVIATPMDMGTVRTRAEAGQYATPQAMQADVALVFDNARRYNPAGSDVYRIANIVQARRRRRARALRLLLRRRRPPQRRCLLCRQWGG
jgi:hypothetical protein